MEIFAAVLECGSVTGAAQRLGLSQPAVSKSLGALEAEIAVPLFLREQRGLRPTQEGRTLYLEAQRLLQSYAFLEGFARNLPQMKHSRLRIGCIPALSNDWLPRRIGTFAGLWPDIGLTLATESSAEIVQMVARGELDLGISHSRIQDEVLIREPLFDLRIRCVVPVSDPLAQQDQVTLADLNGREMVGLTSRDEVQRNLMVAMHQRGYSASVAYECYFGVVACRVAEETGRLAVVDEESCRSHDPQRSRILPLVTPIATPLFLLRNRKQQDSLALQRFALHLKASVESSPEGGGAIT